MLQCEIQLQKLKQFKFVSANVLCRGLQEPMVEFNKPLIKLSLELMVKFNLEPMIKFSSKLAMKFILELVIKIYLEHMIKFSLELIINLIRVYDEI